jgi:dephospho-CoA kinase
MRTSHGPDVWARRTLELVERNADVVVIDGLRSHAELAVFREELGENFLVVLVHCPDELRLERVTSRGRDDDTMSREAFLERDARELSWGLDEVISDADVIIDNTGTLEELRENIRWFLEELGA